MRIDRKLNLVVPVELADGTRAFVHSTPISREVYETYFMVLAKAFASIYSEGLSIVAGPKIAAMLLRSVAQTAGVWEGSGGVQNGLVAEIRRLSNVVLPGPNGWTTMSLHDAITQKMMDDDAIDEVEGIVTFFILNSAVQAKARVPIVLSAMSGLWGTQTTSLNCTEYAASLPTSTGEDSSISRAVSSVPS